VVSSVYNGLIGSWVALVAEVLLEQIVVVVVKRGSGPLLVGRLDAGRGLLGWLAGLASCLLLWLGGWRWAGALLLALLLRWSGTSFEVFQTTLELLAYKVGLDWFVQQHSSCLSRTVVTLGNAVLYPPALGKIWNLGPVLIRVGGGAESAAGALTGVLWRRRRGLGKSSVLHVALEHGLVVVVRVMAGHVVFAMREMIRGERRCHGELSCQHMDAESFTEGVGSLTSGDGDVLV
jgi:hypothetical protein